jgi:uncharacterized phage protein (TIGR02218 family)
MRDLGELAGHLASGATTLARCWRLERRDRLVMGFTDHDRDLAFDGVEFKASTGLDAAAVQSSTGLSVDNSQAVGALSDFGLDEVDIRAGRYDGAEVLSWLVNWRDVSQRVLQFRGSIGEVRRSGGVFEAELRGLAEALNQAQGRAYHRNCSAVLGDQACGFNVSDAGYSVEVVVEGEAGSFSFDGLTDFEERWFERGVLRVLDGAGAGLVGMIRADRFRDGLRVVDLWSDLPVVLAGGDLVRLEAGCDKRAETCRLKFHNFLNYRGFPHIPGEDWAMSYPTRAGVNDGGSLQ